MDFLLKEKPLFFICALFLWVKAFIYVSWFLDLSTVFSCTAQCAHSRAEQHHKTSMSQGRCPTASAFLDSLSALPEVVLIHFTGPSWRTSTSSLCVCWVKIIKRTTTERFKTGCHFVWCVLPREVRETWSRAWDNHRFCCCDWASLRETTNLKLLLVFSLLK